MTQLESKAGILQCLQALKEGYSTGQFDAFFKYLTEDSVFESQWVLEPHVGRDAIVEYLTSKGDVVRRTGTFLKCYFVELVGNCNPMENVTIHWNGETTQGSVGLAYKPGIPCMIMEQTLKGTTNKTLVKVSVDDAGMVRRVDLCMPELFQYKLLEEE